MSDCTQAEKNARLNATKAVTRHIGLLTANPTSDDMTGAAEASYTNYARLAITGAGWSAITDGGLGANFMTNVNALRFAAPDLAQTFTGYAYYDAATGGLARKWRAFATSQAVGVGVNPEWGAGAFRDEEA